MELLAFVTLLFFFSIFYYPAKHFKHFYICTKMISWKMVGNSFSLQTCDVGITEIACAAPVHSSLSL